MATVTVTVPDDLKDRMDEHPEIDWTVVAREAFREKLSDLEVMEAITSDSDVSQSELDELAEAIDAAVAEELTSNHTTRR